MNDLRSVSDGITITDMTTKLNDSQQRSLIGLFTLTNGRVTGSATTRDVAEHLQSNNLAVTASLNALVEARMVRVRLVANASPTGGAYKNAWMLTGKGKATAKQIIHHDTK